MLNNGYELYPVRNAKILTLLECDAQASYSDVARRLAREFPNVTRNVVAGVVDRAKRWGWRRPRRAG